MSTVWVTRAGDSIDHQKFALEHNCVVIGFQAAGGSLESLGTSEAIKVAYKKRQQAGHKNDKEISAGAGQCHAFANKIQRGDYVIMPLKRETVSENLVSTGYSAVGKVVGDYQYNKGAPDGCKHQRLVQWEYKKFSNDKMPWSIVNRHTVSRVRRSKDGSDLESALKGL